MVGVYRLNQFVYADSNLSSGALKITRIRVTLKSMTSPDDRQLKSLISLLDDEDPKSFGLIRTEILRIGEPILPFLDEYRLSCATEIASRVDGLIMQVRFGRLKEEAFRLAANADVDLEKGALLVSRFGYPGIKSSVYTEWLDRIAAQVKKSLPPDADKYTGMQRLNTLLFKELKFTGNEDRYYDPDNSFLNRVIDTRRGIPVSMGILYLLLAWRLDLPVHGVGTPGHFLVGYHEHDNASFYIDAFHQGRLLTSEEVRRMLVRSGYDFRPEFLNPISSREILLRMMRSLIVIYQKMGLTERVEMLSSLVSALQTKSLPEK